MSTKNTEKLNIWRNWIFFKRAKNSKCKKWRFCEFIGSQKIQISRNFVKKRGNFC